MNDPDLTHLLRDWPYEPGRINARRIQAQDGRPKLQVRIDLGVLQMEIHGRPDGLRPQGFESLLEYQLERLHRGARGRDAAAGEAGTTGSVSPDGFTLSADDCRALREEAVQYYHRYVAMFALGEYAGVVRDTVRNLRVFDLCKDFAEGEVDRTILEQFRPPVIMMRARAQAELGLVAGQPRQALAALDQSLNEIKAFFDETGRGDGFDAANEVQLLRAMRDTLVPKLPASQRVELEERLRAALDSENYELAAILRDELRLLKD